jgi:hypothetical protein
MAGVTPNIAVFSQANPAKLRTVASVVATVYDTVYVEELVGYTTGRTAGNYIEVYRKGVSGFFYVLKNQIYTEFGGELGGVTVTAKKINYRLFAIIGGFAVAVLAIALIIKLN